jgi:hypothetical protein
VKGEELAIGVRSDKAASDKAVQVPIPGQGGWVMLALGLGKYRTTSLQFPRIVAAFLEFVTFALCFIGSLLSVKAWYKQGGISELATDYCQSTQRHRDA